MIWAGLSKKASAKASVNIIRTLRVVLAQGEVHRSSCFPFVFPYTDVLTAYDFVSMPGNGMLLSCGVTVLLYGKWISAYAGTMKMGFLFISPCEEANMPCAEVTLLPSRTNLPSFYIIVLPNENKLLCSKVISAYREMFALGSEMSIPYTDAKKMDGSFIRLGSKTISADDDVTLLPNDRTLPSAETILRSGLLTPLSSLLVPFCAH